MNSPEEPIMERDDDTAMQRGSSGVKQNNISGDDLTEAEILALVAEIERKERETAESTHSPGRSSKAPAAAAAARPPPDSLYEELLRYHEEHGDEDNKVSPPQQRREQSDGQNSSSEDDRKPAADMRNGIYRQPISRSFFAQRGSVTTGTQGQGTAEGTDTANSHQRNTASTSAERATSGSSGTSPRQPNNTSPQQPSNTSPRRHNNTSPQQPNNASQQQPQNTEPQPGSLYEELRQQAIEVRKETLAEAAALRLQMEDDEEIARRVQRESQYSLPGAPGGAQPRRGESYDEEEDSLLRQLSGLPISEDKTNSEEKNQNPSQQSQHDRDIDQQRRMLETFQRQKEQKEMEAALKLSRRDPVSKKRLEEDWAKLRRRRNQPSGSQPVSVGPNPGSRYENSGASGMRQLPPISSDDGSHSQSHRTSVSSHSHSIAGSSHAYSHTTSSRSSVSTPPQLHHSPRRDATPYYPQTYSDRGVDRGPNRFQQQPHHHSRPATENELLSGLRPRGTGETLHYPVASRSVASSFSADRAREQPRPARGTGGTSYYPGASVSVSSLDRGRGRRLPGEIDVPARRGDETLRQHPLPHSVSPGRGGDLRPGRANGPNVDMDRRYHDQTAGGTPLQEVRVPARSPYQHPQPLADISQAPGEVNTPLPGHDTTNNNVMPRRSRDTPSPRHTSGFGGRGMDDRYRSGPNPDHSALSNNSGHRTIPMNSERSDRDDLLERGRRETQRAVATGEASVITCVSCASLLQAPAEYNLVYCPNCGVVNQCG